MIIKPVPPLRGFSDGKSHDIGAPKRLVIIKERAPMPIKKPPCRNTPPDQPHGGGHLHTIPDCNSISTDRGFLSKRSCAVLGITISRSRRGANRGIVA